MSPLAAITVSDLEVRLHVKAHRPLGELLAMTRTRLLALRPERCLSDDEDFVKRWENLAEEAGDHEQALAICWMEASKHDTGDTNAGWMLAWCRVHFAARFHDAGRNEYAIVMLGRALRLTDSLEGLSPPCAT